MTALPLPVAIRRPEVLHFLGYGARARPGARIEAALETALEEARALAAPLGVWCAVSADRVGPLGLEPCPGCELAAGLVTIGPALEQRITRLLADGETTRALLLDAAGSAAAEEAAAELERRILAARGAEAGRAARRFSPGYGRWPVTAQRELLALLPHQEIGVRLLPSCLMAPRKSVSFALWLGNEGRPPQGGGVPVPGCRECGLAFCPYRETSPPAEENR